MRKLPLFAAAATAVTVPFLAGQPGAAHTATASASCSGVTATLRAFEDAPGDSVTVSIDGTVVVTVTEASLQAAGADFVNVDLNVPVPQDSGAHTWQVSIAAAGYSGGPFSGTVGPCTQTTTTTVAATTTSTTEAPSTSSTSTSTTTSTQPPDGSSTTSTSTSPTTTAGSTPGTSTTSTTLTPETSTSSSPPSSDSPTTTLPPSNPTTTENSGDCLPATSTSPAASTTLVQPCAPPSLPATATDSTKVLAVAAIFVGCGIVPLIAGRTIKGRGQ